MRALTRQECDAMLQQVLGLRTWLALQSLICRTGHTRTKSCARSRLLRRRSLPGICCSRPSPLTHSLVISDDRVHERKSSWLSREWTCLTTVPVVSDQCSIYPRCPLLLRLGFDWVAAVLREQHTQRNMKGSGHSLKQTRARQYDTSSKHTDTDTDTNSAAVRQLRQRQLERKQKQQPRTALELKLAAENHALLLSSAKAKAKTAARRRKTSPASIPIPSRLHTFLLPLCLDQDPNGPLFASERRSLSGGEKPCDADAMLKMLRLAAQRAQLEDWVRKEMAAGALRLMCVCVQQHVGNHSMKQYVALFGVCCARTEHGRLACFV